MQGPERLTGSYVEYMEYERRILLINPLEYERKKKENSVITISS